jgi:hypothetical protein
VSCFIQLFIVLNFYCFTIYRQKNKSKERSNVIFLILVYLFIDGYFHMLLPWIFQKKEHIAMYRYVLFCLLMSSSLLDCLDLSSDMKNVFPPELYAEIYSYLPLKNIGKLTLVSKNFFPNPSLLYQCVEQQSLFDAIFDIRKLRFKSKDFFAESLFIAEKLNGMVNPKNQYKHLSVLYEKNYLAWYPNSFLRYCPFARVVLRVGENEETFGTVIVSEPTTLFEDDCGERKQIKFHYLSDQQKNKVDIVKFWTYRNCCEIEKLRAICVEWQKDNTAIIKRIIVPELSFFIVISLLDQYPEYVFPFLSMTAFTGMTLLHYASKNGNSALAEKLVQYGIDIDAFDIRGYSPLRYAIEGNYPEIAKLLIHRGAYVNYDILHHACSRGFHRKNVEIVKLLIEARGINPQTTDNYGRNALHYACQSGDLATIRFLIEEKNMKLEVLDKYGGSVLHYACKGGNVETIQFLLQRNVDCDVNVKDHFGKTPLDCAYNWAGKDYNSHRNAIAFLETRGALRSSTINIDLTVLE